MLASAEKLEEEDAVPEDLQAKLEQSQILEQSVEHFDVEGDTEVELRVVEKKGKIMTDENEEKIQISFGTYKRWFGQYYGGSFLLATQAAMLLFAASRIGSDYTIGFWAHNSDGDQFTRYGYYTACCAALCCSMSLAVYLRSAACQLFTLRAGRRIHE